MKTIIAVLVGFAALSSSAMAQDIEPFQQAVTDLGGNWSGTLEYRDYQSDERVEIAHNRSVSFAPDGSYMLTELSYADPGYQVYAAELATLNGQTLLIASIGNGEIESVEATLTEFAETDTGWIARFSGVGMDAGELADFRYVFEHNGDTLVQTKLVRAEGEDGFSFRNAVRIGRVD